MCTRASLDPGPRCTWACIVRRMCTGSARNSVSLVAKARQRPVPKGGGEPAKPRHRPAPAAGRVPAPRPGPACCCTQREVLVELEISAGAAIEAELRTLHADARQRAGAEHILALADQAGYGAALIDALAEDSVINWPQFAHMVRAAAG